MKIIINKNLCSYITGEIAHTGYCLQRRKKCIILQKCVNKTVPQDGHWNAIKYLARVASAGSPIADIEISGRELNAAFYEAGNHLPLIFDEKQVLNAERVKLLIPIANA